MGTLDSNKFSQLAYIINMVSPEISQVEIVSENIGEKTATWNVREKGNPSSEGTIEFVEEEGTWKLSREEWTEQV